MLNQRINYPVAFIKHQTGALKQNLIATLLIIVALIGIVWLMLPPSYNTDLSVIGQGKPVIAVIYDNENEASLRLMEAFNTIRKDYEHLLEFIAIDKNSPKGQQFLIRTKVASAYALYYSGEGELSLILHEPREVPDLVTSIQQTFGF